MAPYFVFRNALSWGHFHGLGSCLGFLCGWLGIGVAVADPNVGQEGLAGAVLVR